MKPLQLIQNGAARLICCIDRREHITPVLKDLHWLPVEARILFKILLTVYKCLNLSAPQYLLNDLHVKTQPFNFRSSHTISLLRPQHCNNFSARAFRNSAPTLWCNLPTSVKTCTSLTAFKKGLKTFLFEKYYVTVC